MKRPVWLFSMDSENFSAPPTTTAALLSYYRAYGARQADTDVELVHFRDGDHIEQWLQSWRSTLRPRAAKALELGLEPIIGFSFYTWNTAEFLHLLQRLKSELPGLLAVAGGPHVQQASDFLGHDPIDVIVLGEGEETFCELLDAAPGADWSAIQGLAYLQNDRLIETPERPRCKDLERFPSPLDVIELTGPEGEPLYESISYETSRGCPFRCAFCEWGTGAIGGKMYQWPLERIQRDWEKIAAAGIRDLWLADSNFGALKQDLDKARIIVELKDKTGLPTSFATSWSKKHSRQVQEIALLLDRHQLLPHYQLALQTLTPEALRLSNRSNMSSNQYEPIAKHMSEQGVPIAAELIWGLPGDNLPDFERNLDQLLATFPNINIFGYTLLPGTEFYERREEYQIEAIPVAGYGKAKGEYVVGCHSFDRDQGEEGYFLISAHILMIHGHIMPLTTRFLALSGGVPVSPLLRTALRALITGFGGEVEGFDQSSRMGIYETRNQLYLHALSQPQRCFQYIRDAVNQWLTEHGASDKLHQQVSALLELDASLCPRTGVETLEHKMLSFDAIALEASLATMELPDDACFNSGHYAVEIHQPGGVGEILLDADGGSWIKGKLSPAPNSQVHTEASTNPQEIVAVALA